MRWLLSGVLSIVIVGWLIQLVTRRPSDNESFIQGTWRAAGEQGAGHAWFMEWRFEEGAFTQTGYPPLEQRGRYRVIGDSESRLQLELYEQRGTFGTRDSNLVIVVNRDRDTLRIENLEEFRRIQRR
jgi:hypothetical protein